MAIRIPISAVLFDWDGTVQDSMPEQYKGFQAVFAEVGMTVPSLEFFCQNLSMPLGPWYESLGVKLEEKRIIEIYRSATNKLTCPLFPGAKELLRELTSRKVVTGIVSSGRKHLIDHLITKHEMENVICLTVCEAWDKIPALRQTCTLRGFDPKRCVYVGDLKSDVRDGHEAGLMTVGFIGPHSCKEAFRQFPPDAYAYSHEELRHILLG